VCICAAQPSWGETLPAQRQQEILHAAQTAFDEAVERARTAPGEAARLYREAAAGFAALADAGIRSAALEYNLGNAHYRLGDRGRAVLHYRRALAIDPQHAQARANLDFVRDQVAPAIQELPRNVVLRSVLAPHYALALNTRFWLAAAFSAAGWLLLFMLLRLRRRPAPLVSAAVIMAGVGALSGGSVLWQLRDEVGRPHAVLTRGEPVLRLGRGESYEPAMKQPLGPGVEVRILSERLDWLEVRLRNGQTGWLPAAGLERV
jgi:tetratricopeptide (TPR) repeat protein